MKRAYGALVFALLFIMAGCDATVELTKAPFDATTHLTDGTSAALSEFTQPLKEFTSSTTPGALAGINPIKARQKVEIFAAYMHRNLETDIARGQGEYLVSLASLAGVPQERQSEFRSHMRNAYASMFDDAISPRESTVRIVEAAWSEGYGGLR